MDLITSASSEMYQQAFSPGLRRTAGSVTATDVLILVLIAVLIVYLLARTFQGQCRTVCHQVCPMDGAEHMTGDSNAPSPCDNLGSNDAFFGIGFTTPLACEEIKVEYTNVDTAQGNGSYDLKENNTCYNMNPSLAVTNMTVSGVSGNAFGHGCNIAKVKVVVEKKEEDGSISTFIAEAQDIKQGSDDENVRSSGVFTGEDGDENRLKFWKIRRIYTVA